MGRSTTRHFDFLDQSFALRADLFAGPGSRPLTVSLGRPAAAVTPAGDAPGTAASGTLDAASTLTHSLLIHGREFRITGSVISSACPDCSAPMSVRLWLGLAECWRCRCVVELDREQLDALAESLGQAARNSSPAPAPPTPETMGGLPVFPPRAPAAGMPELAGAAGRKSGEGWLFGWLPAWLASFLLHLLLILILALIAWGPDPRSRLGESIELVLSTFVNDRHSEGGEIRVQSPDRPLADDVVPNPDLAEAERDERNALSDAAELTRDPDPVSPLRDLNDVRRSVAAEPGPLNSLAVRDPRVREEIIRREGGTTQTEAAVARGLRWLASVQNQDGSWSLENHQRSGNPGNRGDAAGTGLALLPFLGAGQTHEFGIYKQTVARGLAWLLRNQKPDGDLRINFPGQAGMYAHGQCAIVLCEAYALTGDEQLREPSQRAIRFIERAQHRDGGWRYQPGQAGDTSVFGWQLMALQSARETRVLQLDNKVLLGAEKYLDAAGTALRADAVRESGSLYRYQPREGAPTASMTAEAILCRMYLGWKRDDPRIMRSIRWLVNEHLPEEGDQADIYYWYYGTQALHHYGGREWERWNRALRDRLVSMQVRAGRFAGSFDPADFLRGTQGERIFVTSFAVCILEVYYRRLPLFRKLEL